MCLFHRLMFFLLLSFHFLEDYISQNLDLNMGIRQETTVIEFSSVYFMTDLEQNYFEYELAAIPEDR